MFKINLSALWTTPVHNLSTAFSFSSLESGWVSWVYTLRLTFSPEITRLNWHVELCHLVFPHPDVCRGSGKCCHSQRNGFYNPGYRRGSSINSAEPDSCSSGFAIPLLLGGDGHPDLPSWGVGMIEKWLQSTWKIPSAAQECGDDPTPCQHCCPLQGLPWIKGRCNKSHPWQHSRGFVLLQPFFFLLCLGEGYP